MQCYHKLPTQNPPERLIQTVGQHIMYPNTNIPHILSKLYQSCKSEHVRAAHISPQTSESLQTKD